MRYIHLEARFSLEDFNVFQKVANVIGEEKVIDVLTEIKELKNLEEAYQILVPAFLNQLDCIANPTTREQTRSLIYKTFGKPASAPQPEPEVLGKRHKTKEPQYP